MASMATVDIQLALQQHETDEGMQIYVGPSLLATHTHTRTHTSPSSSGFGHSDRAFTVAARDLARSKLLAASAAPWVEYTAARVDVAHRHLESRECDL